MFSRCHPDMFSAMLRMYAYVVYLCSLYESESRALL